MRDLAGTTLVGMSVKGALRLVRNILLPGSVNDHVARAYAKQCGLRDPLTDVHIRSGFRTTAPNPAHLDRLLGLKPDP